MGRYGLIVGATLCVALASAQEQPRRFPSGTAVVRLDVVARDQNGRPLTDLQADEVTVLENGVPATLADFRFVTIASSGSSTVQAAAAQPGTDAPVSVVVIVLDALSPQASETTRKAALQLLAQSPGSNTWLAVYRIGDGLRLVQAFTRDTTLVAKAFGAAAPNPTLTRAGAASPGPESAANPTEPPSDDAGGAFVSVAERFARAEARLAAHADEMGRVQSARGSLYPLLALVRGLGEVQGRKSMVLFSDGLHVARDSKSGIDEVFRSVVSEANRANVTVYGLSPEGLQGLAGADESGPPVFQRETRDASALESHRFVLHGNLRALAEDTGGFLVADTNDLSPGIARVASELRSWYEVAYVSPAPDSDRGFRRIEIRLSRRGVALRGRSGYYPSPAAPAATSQPAPTQVAIPNAVTPVLPKAASPAAEAPRFTEPDRAQDVIGSYGSRTKSVPNDAATSELLRKAAEYVQGCEQTFRHVVAEELYMQWGPDATSATVRRTLRSDLVFVSLPGEIPWTTFRDVYEVDGQAVREREARLERLFMHPSRDAFAQADRILREGARYNLGDAFRTVNVPTLALLFLHARNQPRFSFARKGSRLFDGISGVEVAFEEVARPSIVRDSYGGSVPVKGRAWIDPTRGTVLRIEADYDLTTDHDRAHDKRQTAYISTSFKRQDALDAHVPMEMKELYLTGAGRIESTARYSNFRRFRVETEESMKTVLDEPEPRD